MQLLGSPAESAKPFHWFQLTEITNQGKKRRYFNSPSFGIVGRWQHPTDYFLLKRGRQMYYCRQSKAWRTVKVLTDYVLYMAASWRDGPDFISLYANTTHAAVRLLQRWWRRELQRAKMLVFHLGVKGLDDDCIVAVLAMMQPQ
jgi:hypothetical protein